MRYTLPFIAFLVLACVGQGLRDPAFVSISGRGAGKAYEATPEAVLNGTNSSLIIINDEAAATPYPSEITLASNGEEITNVTVVLYGFTHSFCADVGIILESPEGTAVGLMVAAGASASAVNTTLTIDDSGGGTFRPWISGTYKPTGSSDEVFDPPAPIYGNYMSDFEFEDLGGVWKLYVQDFSGGDSGAISNGWSIDVKTQPINSIAATMDQPYACFGEPFTGTFTGSGGVAPYTWEFLTGWLSVEYTFTPTNLTGVTATSVTNEFLVKVRDANGNYKYSTVSFVALGFLTAASLPNATTGVEYNQQIVTTNIPSAALYVTSSNLPPGLTMNSSGLITGTVTDPITNTFTVTVTNSTVTCNRTFTLMCNAP